MWKRIPEPKEIKEKILDLATDPAGPMTPNQIYFKITKELRDFLGLVMASRVTASLVKEVFPAWMKP